mgnify:FL=1
MRKEATLKMWWELYEAACRTADIKPWDYLTKEQHVVIQLKGEKEPVFIRVLGQENEEDKEIEIYPGFRGWQDLTMIQGLGEGEETELSEDYAMSDRRALVCHYGAKSDVPNTQKEISNLLNLPMAKEEMWPHFISCKSRYLPFTPDFDEVSMMKEAVTALQGVTSLPLQIDTVDPRAMEEALRVYNGKPMVNSVSGKQESMDAVFPLIQKYGGVVVGLTLDETGIPETADGRVEIAERILKEAENMVLRRKIS